MKSKKQFAALPYVMNGDSVEICLITSLTTRRWIIPKGWPQKNLAPHKLAALEAFEEAGLKGKTGKKSLGHYHYDKQLDDGSVVDCDVDVFPMRVESQSVDWPEKGQRDLAWANPKDAAKLLDDAELAKIVRKFQPRAH
ncbi:MAG: NUDIX hydrolase [Pseudomonadota bacterium]